MVRTTSRRNPIKHTFERMFSMLSHDIGVDLGTANTLIYVRGKGVVINEPSVVSVNKKTGRIIDIGHTAKRMFGRTPQHIEAVQPLVGGVVSEYDVAEDMLGQLIDDAQRVAGYKVAGPRILIGVPSGVTNVERRAVKDAAKNAGARAVYLIEEPVAAAIGMRLPIHEPVGNMIVDIGGGTSDIAILSLNGIVASQNLKMAGDQFDDDIISYIRDEHRVLIGEKTAERLKLHTTSITHPEKEIVSTIRGRDLVTGLPKEIVVTDADIRTALSFSIDTLVSAMKSVLESAPPEIVADVIERGIYLTGGGALLNGLDAFLSDWLSIPVYIGDDPLTAVARGTGIVLENFDDYKHMMVRDDEALPLLAT